MSLIYRQTDTASGYSFTLAGRQAVEGGTAGTGTVSMVWAGGAAHTFGFEIAPGDVDWKAGNVVARINFSAWHNNVALQEIRIKRVNSDNELQETLATDTDVAADPTTGVYSRTIAIPAVASPATTDKLIVEYYATRPAGGGNRTCSFVPDQNIDTPLEEGTNGVPASYSAATKRAVTGSASHSPATLRRVMKPLTPAIISLVSKTSSQVVISIDSYDDQAMEHHMWRSTGAGSNPSQGIKIGDNIDPTVNFVDNIVTSGETKRYAIESEPGVPDVSPDVSAFIILVNTQNLGSSNDDQFQFTGALGNYDVEVWNSAGDSLLETITGLVNDATITISAGPGIYELRVIPAETDGFHQICFDDTRDTLKVVEVRDLGSVAWSGMSGMFSGCANMVLFNSPTIPNLSNVQFMDSMFSRCTGLTELNLSGWDTANVQFMAGMFSECMNLTDIVGIEDFNISSMSDQYSFSGFLFQVTLPTLRYSNLLINYEAQVPNTSLLFHGGFSQYNTNGATARNSLVTTYEWSITDGGPA